MTFPFALPILSQLCLHESLSGLGRGGGRAGGILHMKVTGVPERFKARVDLEPFLTIQGTCNQRSLSRRSDGGERRIDKGNGIKNS